MENKGMQPKTDKLKAYLKSYLTLQERIDQTEARLMCLELSKGAPSTSNLSGMGGGSHDRSSKQERNYITEEELTEKLGEMYREENNQREEIEELVALMRKPKEQAVIQMHYLDGTKWSIVNVALFGEEPDFDENVERYKKRTFKIHGAALQTLARIYEKQKETEI